VNLLRRVPGARREWLAAGYFVLLSLGVFYPVLGRGYVLSLDMVFGPHVGYVGYLVHTKGPLYYGRLPFLALLDAASLGVPQWVLQKLLLVALLVVAGLAAYRASSRLSTPARLFAGTLYAVNPFVYVRLLAGHWYFLFGYAVLPLAVVAFDDYLRGRSRLARSVGWATVVSVFDPHAAFLLGLACAGLALVSSRKRTVARRLAAFGGGYAAVNAYWLLPAVADAMSGQSHLSTISGVDLATFTAQGTVAGNVPLSLAMLYGFWRGGYAYPFDQFPLPVVVGLFGVVLFLAVYGWYSHRDEPLANGLALTALVGLVLGMGVSYPYTAPVFRLLAAHVPAFAGMRDSQKFVALLALAYALLGARGVDRLASARWPSGIGLTSRLVALDTRRLVALALVVLLLLVPFLYTPTLFAGGGGQLRSVSYPDGWRAANAYLTADGDAFRVLFLPWHQYLRFSWTGRTVADPADIYFQKPVLRSRTVDVGGVESQATDPAHRRVRRLLAEGGNATDPGARLAALGVKYVVLAKVADHRRYAFVRTWPNTTVVLENQDVVVFENQAFDRAPSPAAWPRDSPLVPLGWLGAGAVVSLGSLLALLGERRV